MMAGQRSPKTRPTTLSQQGSTVLSQSRNIIYYVITVVVNNKDIMKITVHGELNIYFLFTENNFAKSHFMASMEITIHKEKISHFTFHGEKKRADHESRKYPLPPSTKDEHVGES